jgi:hypothetical protein
MARLPNPGADGGVWGTLLNEYLEVEHNTDGTLKAGGTLATKADDSTVVHLAGNQTIAGTKTFSAAPVVPSGAFPQAAVTNLTSDLAGRLVAASNLGDVADADVARTNLSAPEAAGFATITVGTTAPGSPAVGDIWVDTN